MANTRNNSSTVSSDSLRHEKNPLAGQACDLGSEEVLQESPTQTPPLAKSASWLLGGSIIFSLFCVLSGKIALWSDEGPVLFSSMRSSLLLALGLLALSLTLFKYQRQQFNRVAFLEGSASALLLFFLSDWMSSNYSLLLAPSIRGEILLSSLVLGFCSLRFGVSRLSYVLFPLSLCILLYNFARATKGRLLFGDDHSVFLHRLSLLSENFPSIPIYDTSWNGGLDSMHLFATGVLNVFFIWSAFVYSLNVEDAYTVIVALTLFCLTPVCAYLATRILNLAPAVACISAVLSVSQGLFFYRWGLVYGTMGFITSCALLPLVFALFVRFLRAPSNFSIVHAVGLCISCTLMLFWPLAGVPFVMIAGLLLLDIKAVFREKRFIVACLTVVLLTVPWVYVLWTGWNVKSFIAAESPGTHEVEISKSETKFKGVVFRAHERRVSLPEVVRILRDNTSPLNPLLLVFSLPGILLLRSRKSKIAYGSTAVWLIAVACIGGPLKPQLELERMLLMLSGILLVPAALGIFTLVEAFFNAHTSNRKVFTGIIAFLSLGFLLAGVFSTAGIVANRRIEQFHFAKPSFFQVAETIKRESAGGRMLFTGFVLHELNEGHLAPLSHFSRTPMIASSHVHNVWQYRDIIPESYRALGPPGIADFLDLWNVSLLAAHEPSWRALFRALPEHYEELGAYGRFVFFKRRSFPNSYFLEGSGEIVSQDTAGIQLRLSSKDALIAFRYNPNLKVDGCEQIRARTVAPDIDFIELSSCTTTQVIRVSSKSFFERIGHSLTAAVQKMSGSIHS